jgi:hypothetical protein
VAGAFVDEPAAVLAQVPLELAPLHAAIVSCSGSLLEGGVSGSGVSIRRSRVNHVRSGFLARAALA